MKRLLAIVLLVLAADAAAQTTIDRIVAVVNKRVITQTDWDEQERFEALVNGRAPESVKLTSACLDRLVDQRLMSEQIESVRFEPLTAAQVAAQVAAVRKQIPGAESDAQWQSLLARYRLTPEEFEQRVRAQVEVMRFVDMRFRPSVHIESEQVEAYYEKSLVPDLMKAGTKPEGVPQLKEVEPKIRSILSEEKLNEMLQMWLVSLRTQGRVKRLMPETKTAEPTGAD